MPARTSPLPPVAMPGLPVSLMNMRPSGVAITVPGVISAPGLTWRTPSTPSVANHTSITGLNTLAIPAVPRFCTTNKATMITIATGITQSANAAVATSNPSTADSTEIAGVNFQTPTTTVYAALRALIAGYIGRDPFEDGCVVVSTIGDERLTGMPFDEFIRFAPHGVEGASATIDPPVAEPIYFNASVLPDPNQVLSSIDGGVLWANVPPGTYTLEAHKEGVEFAQVRATCEPGWVVNANPVHGLHALPSGG